MFTILKKELKSLLRKPTAYIFIAVLLAFTGIFTSIYNFYDGLAKPEYIISGLSIILALMIPFTVMDLFDKDRKTSADRLLFSLRFKTSDIVLGIWCSPYPFLNRACRARNTSILHKSVRKY